MTHYHAGRRFEWKCRDYLRTYLAFPLVMRTAGSHSPFDLIAVGTFRIWLVQCKQNIGCKAAMRLGFRLDRQIERPYNVLCVIMHKQEKHICWHEWKP